MEGRQSTGLAGYMGWVRKLLSGLLPEFLVVRWSTGLERKIGWARNLLSRLLFEFLEREVIHGLGGIYEVGAQVTF